MMQRSRRQQASFAQVDKNAAWKDHHHLDDIADSKDQHHYDYAALDRHHELDEENHHNTVLNARNDVPVVEAAPHHTVEASTDTTGQVQAPPTSGQVQSPPTTDAGHEVVQQPQQAIDVHVIVGSVPGPVIVPMVQGTEGVVPQVTVPGVQATEVPVNRVAGNGT